MMAKQAERGTAVAVLDKLPDSRLPVAPEMLDRMGLTPEQWQILTDQTFPSARTAAAVHMALTYCKVRGMDIFKRPVHIVPMWSTVLGRMVETIWPGIAELRTTASRTGLYAGISEAEFGPTIERTFEIKYTDERTQNDTIRKYPVSYPEWCSLKVYKIVHGQAREFHARVYWMESYAVANRNTDCPNEMWRKRPFGQLEKCTEAAALRRAFPEEIGNELTSEEMSGKTIDHDSEDQISRMVTEKAEAGGEQRKRVAPKPPEPKQQQATKQPDEKTNKDADWSISEAEAEYLQTLRDRLGEAKTETDALAIFKELDPHGFFHDDQDSQDVCQSILDYRLGVIARTTKERP
jgi:phage recombination protein Bet